LKSRLKLCNKKSKTKIKDLVMTLENLLPGYTILKLNHNFAIRNGLFVGFAPILVPYNSLNSAAIDNNLNPFRVGVIEKAASFGLGWIGVYDQYNTLKLNHKTVTGNYFAFEYVGKYSELRQAYQKVMQDYPTAYDFYNLYKNDPKTTKPKDLKTLIAFKIK
jgi:hypothetical protein